MAGRRKAPLPRAVSRGGAHGRGRRGDLRRRHQRDGQPAHGRSSRRSRGSSAFAATGGTPRAGTTTSTSPASALRWWAWRPAPFRSCRSWRDRLAALRAAARAERGSAARAQARPRSPRPDASTAPALAGLLRRGHEKPNVEPRCVGARQQDDGHGRGHPQDRSGTCRKDSCATCSRPTSAWLKRPLVSDDFYPALMRDDVGRRQRRGAGGDRDRPRHRRRRSLDEVDVIVYCTGYRILDFDRIDVARRRGGERAERMAEAPEGAASPCRASRTTRRLADATSASFFTETRGERRDVSSPLLREKADAGGRRWP